MVAVPHPDQALFEGSLPPPSMPSCEHIAGKQKLIEKAFAIQQKMGPLFDITCDCEDGAPTGHELEHAEMIATLIESKSNLFGRVGARIHDVTHPAWRQDIETLIKISGSRLAYITLPKINSAAEVALMNDYVRTTAKNSGVDREIPIHVLVETQIGLRDVWNIAALSCVETIDFGLMDFVSDHQGAISAQCMRSPGQFEHHLLARAKSEIVAAALANSCIPAHNVTLELRNYEVIFLDALRARNEFGFLRMWSIHPNQIQPIIDAMKPELNEVNTGAEILLKAYRINWAPIQYEGELHDRASYRYFWNLIKKAYATGIELPLEIQRAFFD